jgi:signal transduction histidine kinase
MEAVGQLAGGIAHDFNNLLTAIIGYADLLRAAEGSTAVVREDASAIKATAARGAELARSLLTLARTAPARDEPVDLHQAINEVRDIASRTFDRRIAVHVRLDARHPVVAGDRSLLTNAFLNLALNARDAMPNGGELLVTTEERILDQDDCARLAGVINPGSFIVVRFADTGTGMPPSIQRRVFEPFFTNKPAGKGTGIGLSMVYGTVRSHSGAIELE